MEIMNQIESLKKIAKNKLANNDPAHDFEHVMRVYRNAERICKTENGNKKLILSAVLLHDIIKIKNRKSLFVRMCTCHSCFQNQKHFLYIIKINLSYHLKLQTQNVIFLCHFLYNMTNCSSEIRKA